MEIEYLTVNLDRVVVTVNFDCIVEIFRHLSTEDQLNFWKAFPHLGKRLLNDGGLIRSSVLFSSKGLLDWVLLDSLKAVRWFKNFPGFGDQAVAVLGLCMKDESLSRTWNNANIISILLETVQDVIRIQCLQHIIISIPALAASSKKNQGLLVRNLLSSISQPETIQTIIVLLVMTFINDRLDIATQILNWHVMLNPVSFSTEHVSTTMTIFGNYVKCACQYADVAAIPSKYLTWLISWAQETDPDFIKSEILENSVFYALNMKQESVAYVLLSYPSVNVAWDRNVFLLLAVGQDFPIVLDLILKSPGSDPGINDNQAFRIASRMSRVRCLTLLLQDWRTRVSETGTEELFHAILESRFQIAQVLCQNTRAAHDNDRIDTDPSLTAAFQIACLSGNLEPLRFLFSMGIRVADFIFMWALRFWPESYVHWLIQVGNPLPSVLDSLALSIASERKFPNIIQQIRKINEWQEIPKPVRKYKRTRHV